MTTELKNAWITSEKRYQKLFKENAELKDAAILSQISFCSDTMAGSARCGVIIKKYKSENTQDGISFQVFNEAIEEVKTNKSSKPCNDSGLLEVKEFGMDENQNI